MPFIREGVEAGEPVMVAAIGERTDLLRDALGGDADQVCFVDMAAIGRNPARIIPAWQRFLSEHAGEGRPLRGIGEPIWAGRRPEELAECQLHEALLNISVDPKIPFWLLCPYDTGRLDPSVIEEAQRSHPAIIEAGEYRGSSHYVGRPHLDAMFASVLTSMPGPPSSMAVDATTVAVVPNFVAEVAHRAGVGAEKAAELGTAILGLAVSSLDRGASEGQLRAWTSSGALTYEIEDPTALDDPLIGRRAPLAETADSLWTANQLCDLVQVRSTEARTTIRVHHWL